MMKYNNLKVLFTDDIFAYIDLNRGAILEYLKDNDIDAQPNEIEDCAYMMINDDLQFLNNNIANFDKNAEYQKIAVVYSLGLWYGERTGVAYCKTLKEALNKAYQDINILYFDNDKTTLKLSSSHHDGTNNYKFYKVKNGKKYAIKYGEFMQL